MQFYFHFIEKRYKKYNPMASRPKRKFVSARGQERLMQEFYN